MVTIYAIPTGFARVSGSTSGYTHGLKSMVTIYAIPTGLARVSGSTSGYTYGLKSMVTIYAIPTGFLVLVALLVATPTD